MNVPLIILLIYIALMLIIAWYSSRKESLETYFLNEKSTGLIFMTFSIVATMIGAGATIGIVSQTYATGISYGIALPISMVFAVILMGIVAKKIKKIGDEYGAYTLVDFFHKRFDRKNRIVMFMVQLFVLVLWIAVQALGIASLASVLIDIDFNIALLIAASATIMYTAVGGLKADILTDFVQFWIILIVFIIVAFLGYQEIHGFTNLVSQLPEGHLNIFAFGGIIWFLGVIFLGGFFVLGDSANWQRIIATKNQKVARNSFFLSIPIILFLSLIILFFGLLASIFLKDINQDLALFSLMKFILPSYLLGLGYASILAVIMSSIDSLLVGGSTILYREMFKDKIDISNKKGLFYARLITALLGVFAFSLAYLIPKIVTLSLITTYLAVTIAIPVIFALYTKVSANASFYAISISTISLFITFPIIGPNSFVVPLVLVFGILLFYDKVFKRKEFSLNEFYIK